MDSSVGGVLKCPMGYIRDGRKDVRFPGTVWPCQKCDSVPVSRRSLFESGLNLTTRFNRMDNKSLFPLYTALNF